VAGGLPNALVRSFFSPHGHVERTNESDPWWCDRRLVGAYAVQLLSHAWCHVICPTASGRLEAYLNSIGATGFSIIERPVQKALARTSMWSFDLIGGIHRSGRSSS